MKGSWSEGCQNGRIGLSEDIQLLSCQNGEESGENGRKNDVAENNNRAEHY